jgi:hypothetical protein
MHLKHYVQDTSSILCEQLSQYQTVTPRKSMDKTVVY